MTTHGVEDQWEVQAPRVGRLRRRSAARPSLGPADFRSFDPIRIGALESQAWVAYYRREWLRFISLGAVCARQGFGLSWPETMICSWLVMRANQRWAPYPDNDAAGARRTMARFYARLARRYGVPLDPERAAELDVDWWRVHREIQHGHRFDESALGDAIARFWAELYEVPARGLSVAAAERARAMRISDRWVAQGCPHDSPLVGAARAALEQSYVHLLEAVQAA